MSWRMIKGMIEFSSMSNCCYIYTSEAEKLNSLPAQSGPLVKANIALVNNQKQTFKWFFNFQVHQKTCSKIQ